MSIVKLKDITGDSPVWYELKEHKQAIIDNRKKINEIIDEIK